MKEFIEKLIGMLEEVAIETLGINKGQFAMDKGEYSSYCSLSLCDVKEQVNQLAEEYKGEELSKSQKIYNFIKREINPYGKPFEGTVYEFGLKVMKYIENLHTEEYKDKSNIIYDLKAFLKEKVKYNSEQAEIWRSGSDKDSYFRQQKDLYMDRANTYGEVMRIVNQLTEEHNNGWITDRNPTREECGEYGHAEFQVTIPQSKGNETITMDFVYETVRGKEVARWKWHGRLPVWEVLAWKQLDAPYQPKGE